MITAEAPYRGVVVTSGGLGRYDRISGFTRAKIETTKRRLPAELMQRDTALAYLGLAPLDRKRVTAAIERLEKKLVGENTLVV
jgi:hypothetical protein